MAPPDFGGLLNDWGSQMLLLDPVGPIAADEKSLLLMTIALLLLVVLPVFVMTFLFAWRYRASNSTAAYTPKWNHSRAIELVVWLVPAAIVGVLGLLTWTSTHTLSPYKPLATAASQDPIPVDAVALNWKWLFIYPRQHIATVNQLVFPTHMPVSFRLTSETVLTSFFIPRLGSQIYAMPGMRTKLHLLADKPGTYTGRNYQFDGRGYSWMQFKVIATTPGNFQKWVNKVRRSSHELDSAVLQKLEKPSIAAPVTYYSSVNPHLFDRIIGQLMTARSAGHAHNAARRA